MTLTVTHAFVSGIADDPAAAAAGEVLPQAHWNANHTITGTVGPSIGARTILAANTSYFVSATGSDSNSGLSSGTAWATLQHAMVVIATTLDIAGFVITVNIGAGTFAGFGEHATVGGGQINWIGNGSTSTKLSAGPNDGTFNVGEAFSAYFGTNTVFGFDKLTFDSTTSGYALIGLFLTDFHMYLGPSGAVDLAFTMITGYNALYDGGSANTINLGNNNGTITVNYSPASTTQTNPTLQMLSNGTILDSGITWAITGTPVFSQANLAPFVYFNQGGTYNGTASFTGSATGPSIFLNAFSIWDNGAFSLPTNTIGFVDTSSGLLIQGDTSTPTGDIGVYGLAPFTTVSNIFTKFAGSGYSNNISGGSFWGVVKATTDGPRFLVINDGGTVFASQVGNNINTQTVSYTLALLDLGGIVEMNLAGANTVTVPTNASVAFPLGTKISVVQQGAGATTIAAAGGVTLHNAGALTGQFASALLYKRGTNEWTQINGAF